MNKRDFANILPFVSYQIRGGGNFGIAVRSDGCKFVLAVPVIRIRAASPESTCNLISTGDVVAG
jgi:hypothetical protein